MMYQVEGMSCEGCVSAVEKIARRALGVDAEAVRVELESKRMHIDGGEEIDREAIEQMQQKLAKQGFRATLLA